MQMTEPTIAWLYISEYQAALRQLMKAQLSNPFFITIRMKQHPDNGQPRLSLERAWDNNGNFLKRLHRELLGNNWQRRLPGGLQRFVFVENSASVGIHTHMLIESNEMGVHEFESAALKSYIKTPYAGQPYKYFNDGELIDIRPAHSNGVIDYITKTYSKRDFDLAFDVKNSYWKS